MPPNGSPRHPSAAAVPSPAPPVPLTRFGGVTFTDIAATGNAHPGTLSDATWTATPIELIADPAAQLAPCSTPATRSGPESGGPRPALRRRPVRSGSAGSADSPTAPG